MPSATAPFAGTWVSNTSVFKGTWSIAEVEPETKPVGEEENKEEEKTETAEEEALRKAVMQVPRTPEKQSLRSRKHQNQLLKLLVNAKPKAWKVS